MSSSVHSKAFCCTLPAIRDCEEGKLQGLQRSLKNPGSIRDGLSTEWRQAFSVYGQDTVPIVRLKKESGGDRRVQGRLTGDL